MARDTQNDEQTPLLGGGVRRDGSPPPPIHHVANGETTARNESTLPPTTSSRVTPPSRRLRIALSLSFLALVLAVGGDMADASLNPILEELICKQVHGEGVPLGNLLVGNGDGDGDDPCKDAEVQSQLATLMGWFEALFGLPGILLTVPYGAFADRSGRSVVLGLSMLGMLLFEIFLLLVCSLPDVFPLEMIWLAPITLIIGGGGLVFNSVLYIIVADISTDTQRSTAFLYLGAVIWGSSIIGNPIIYLALNRSPWFALKLGILLMTLATIIAFSVPETLDKEAARQAAPVPAEDQTNGEEDDDNGKSKAQRLLSKVWGAASATLQTIRWLFWEHKLVGLLLVGLVFEVMGRRVETIETRYISKRYRVTYAQVSLLQTVQNVTTFLVLTCIVPLVAYLFTKKLGLSSREKDLRLAQGSAVVTAVGVLVMAMAESIPVVVAGMVACSLGAAYTFTVRGLMSSLIGGTGIGLLYSCIALAESMIALTSPLAYNWLYRVALRKGEAWIGLPYTVSAWILIAAAVLIGVIRQSVLGSAKLMADGDGDADAEGGEQEEATR